MGLVRALAVTLSMLSTAAMLLTLVNCQGRPNKQFEVIKMDNALTAGSLPERFTLTADFPLEAAQACARAAESLNFAVDKNLLVLLPVGSPKTGFLLKWGQEEATPPDHQAVTKLTYSQDSIIKVTIEFDTKHFRYSSSPSANEVDLESVCLHEMGHALGLPDSEDSDSMMYHHLQNGQRRRDPGAQDIAALKALYP